MTTPLLELRGVNKSFGVVHVLHDVDFAVYPGQVTALVGDNGAGKSTLVKIIAGIYGRDSGDYVFEGKKVEEILKLIDEDEDIAVLVLGAAVDAKGPGPLVSSLAAGKAAGTYPVPITIVPGNLTLDDLLALA